LVSVYGSGSFVYGNFAQIRIFLLKNAKKEEGEGGEERKGIIFDIRRDSSGVRKTGDHHSRSDEVLFGLPHLRRKAFRRAPW
jgi:hypothetical protein